MNIVFFDVVDFEERYLLENININNIGYALEKSSLNSVSDIKEEYLQADIISIFTTSKLSKEVLEKFPNLKMIALRSVGFNHVDLDYCKEKNIKVSNTPGYGNITVAEFTLALLLDVCRKVTYSFNEYSSGRFNAMELIGSELYGKTVGIIGLGAIGKEFARICNGLGMKVIAYDKHAKIDDFVQKYSIQYVEYENLLKEADFISLHAPLTKQNYHLIDKDGFSMMKKGAIIINTGRGELIDINELYKALVNGNIAGAGLDVLEYEENITDNDYIVGINKMEKQALEKTIINNKLFQLKNVVITPHIAYNTNEAIDRIIVTAIRNILNFVETNEVINLVN